jgi:hypothetical protein
MAEDDADGTAWRQILSDLKDGKLVTIPVTDDAEAHKKAQQLNKRAERHGFQIEVEVANGLVQARRTSDIDPNARGSRDRDAEREARRAERRASREQAGSA